MLTTGKETVGVHPPVELGAEGQVGAPPMAMTLEGLYRLRDLHRGAHAVRTAIERVRQLWLSLGASQAAETLLFSIPTIPS